MVDSPNYEKLKVFLQYAKANENLSNWEKDHKEAEKGFQDAIERLKQYRDSHGFTGKAADAMDNWVNSSIRRINGYRDQYTRGYEAYEAGRSAMAAAYSEGQSIKDELLDASTAAMRYNPVVFVPASDPGGGFRWSGACHHRFRIRRRRRSTSKRPARRGLCPHPLYRKRQDVRRFGDNGEF